MNEQHYYEKREEKYFPIEVKNRRLWWWEYFDVTEVKGRMPDDRDQYYESKEKKVSWKANQKMENRKWATRSTRRA